MIHLAHSFPRSIDTHQPQHGCRIADVVVAGYCRQTAGMETLQVSFEPDFVHAYFLAFGAFTFLVGTFGKLLKDKCSLSEPLLALAFGSILGPNVLGWLEVGDVLDDPSTNSFLLEITRTAIAVQVSGRGPL